MPDVPPYRNSNFLIQVVGLPEMSFKEVVLPASRIQVVEYREGGDVSGTRKLPGAGSTGNLVLRRGIDQNLSLWNWFAEVRDGDLRRRDVVILLRDAQGLDVRRWQIFNAWPAADDFSPLDGQGNEVMIETVELACERVDVEEP
jgi:phage tail-like protein